MCFRARPALRLLLLPALTALVANTALPKAPFTADALWHMARVDDPQISPDGSAVAFTVERADIGANTKQTSIYTVPLNGGTPRQLTDQAVNCSRPRWMRDGKHLTFVTERGGAVSQIWQMNADGTDQIAITNVGTGADNHVLSPDGKWMAFTSEVFPACAAPDAKPGAAFDAECNKRNLDEEANAKMHARVLTGLLYRHWTAYAGSRRRHILIAPLAAANEVKDLTPGMMTAPPFSLGGPDPFAFAPDSSALTYVANVDPDPASSTNSDLFTVAVTGGEARRLTTNPGADEGPSYSPDGHFLAYRTQLRSGYESDQWRLAVLDLSSPMEAPKINMVADALDRWVESYAWSHDSQRLFFTLNDHGATPLMMTSPVGGAAIRVVAQGPTTLSAVQFTADDKAMVFAEQSGSHPVELKRAVSKGGAAIALTHLNDDLMGGYELPAFEKFSTAGADGSAIESFLVKPPGFDAKVRYPVLFLIHGGPEGEWGESWSYRWNAQVFAAAGYVVVMPNPRGSAGYGQAFTDAVNKDWGGRAYDDIMAVVSSVSALGYVDNGRMAAAGASYGGYMIDWMLGHTDRFRALVTHAGIFDLPSEAEATDELWFAKWEFDGMPWESPDQYAKWSPSSYVKSFKTPTLVTHGELDYRVPINQAQELFTALQESKVESKLVQFPDEGHWILKPQNSLFWYKAVLEWLDGHTKSTPSTAATGGVE